MTQNGLHRRSVADWLELTRNYPTLTEIKHSIEQVTQYLTTESQHIREGFILPSRSDIIESLFSKYKQFLNSSSFSEINEMVLSFYLFTTEITTDKILTEERKYHSR